MLAASLVVIGDEILGGFVQDTNTGFLARRLRAHGVPLERVHTVPDDAVAIDEALSTELARARPRLVLTTGGIGSTPDDITFEAVAASLGRDLCTEPAIAARLEGALSWTQAQGVESAPLRDDFLRMARVPQGARLLRHDGWAPGVVLDVDGGIDAAHGATIVILPGVPGQTRRIVADGLEPELLAGRATPWTVVEVEHMFPESVLNPLFGRVMSRFDDVTLGSYPGDPMLVRLQGPRERVEEAASVVREGLDDLAASEGGARLSAAWQRRLHGE